MFPGPLKVHKYELIPNAESDDEHFNDVSFISQKSSPAADVLPQFLDPYSIPNLGIIVSYITIGVVSKVTQTPVEYYLIDHLAASSQQYSAFKTLHKLPWTTKFLFGMLSDGISVNGYRRKPWLVVGWVGFTIVNIVLVYLQSPGINTTIFLVVGFTFFLVLSDVCTDTLCVERSRYENDKTRGGLQSTGFVFRSFGRVVGSVMGTFLYDNGESWSFNIAQIFLLDALIPFFCMLLVIWPLVEIAPEFSIPKFTQQIGDVWRVLQLRAVWRPMIFIFIYNALQVPNSAFDNFLVWGLGFGDEQLGYLTIATSIIGCAGYIVFKVFLFETGWRNIYIGTSLVSAFTSLMQIFLILRINVRMGIPDIFFAIGDEAMVALMEGLHAMPVVIMFVMLCPEGAEGTTFALLTTLSTVAGTVASDLGSWCTEIWDVSNTSFAAGDFNGVLKLTILTSLIQLTPLVLIRVLPDGREDHKEEVERGISSWWGGFCLTLAMGLSLLLTLGLNFFLLF